MRILVWRKEKLIWESVAALSDSLTHKAGFTSQYSMRKLDMRINLPEAIRNVVTPVATPRSVRPGVFLTHFAPGRQRPYHSLTNRFF